MCRGGPDRGTDDTAVVCWGRNAKGNLGVRLDNSVQNTATPVVYGSGDRRT